MNLHQISDAEDEERVDVDFITEYLVTKKDKLSKLIHLHYYDSTSKGYLSIEVIIFFCFDQNNITSKHIVQNDITLKHILLFY